MPEISLGRLGSNRQLARCSLESEGIAAMNDEKLRALPRDTPDYHARQAAHLRALAEHATTVRIKARLLREAEQHECLAAPSEEEPVAEPTGP